MRRRRPIGHDDRLSIVEHLDELRSRLLFSGLAFVVAWAVTGWQNHAVLEILNRPLPPELAEPITLSPPEAFYTTLTTAAYAGILLALPVILYQLYAFILPAFSSRERKVALPLLLLIPVLFVAGVVFCYFVVLGPAMEFLLSFNSDEFQNEVRAKDYYSFVILLLLAMGIGFQIPVGVLTACRLGVTSAAQLRSWRRYAIVAVFVLAALLPTIDPLTLVLEAVPLYALYELSILLAGAFGKPASEPPDQATAEGSG